MNSDIIQLTIRQTVSRRRTLLMIALALLPVVTAIVYAAGSSDESTTEFAANGILNGFVVTLVLPLVALVFGTAALGGEIDDGTAVYILAKPIPRASVVISKIFVAWLGTVAIVLPCAIVSGLVAIGGSDPSHIVFGFSVAVVVGALAYSCVFMFLSVLTSRALIIGLVYVFLWEGIVNDLFTGTRLLSVRQYTLAIADMLTSVADQYFDAKLNPLPAIILVTVVIVGATVLAIRRLERFEIGETA